MSKFDYLLNKLRTKDGGAGVTSVNGQDGNVVLTAASVGAPSGSGTSTGVNTGDQDLGGFVPYSGAVSDVNLGAKALTAGSFNGVQLATGGAGAQYLSDDGTYKPVSTGGGGDVYGPAMSTDNVLTKFDGTSGKLIQTSGILVSDANDLSAVNSVTYSTAPVTVPSATGTASWNVHEGTLDVQLLNGVTLQEGQELHWFVRNNTGATIGNMVAVYVTGTIGNSGRLTVAPYRADGSVPAAYFLGVTTQKILPGSDGYVTTFGKIRNVDTSGYAAGSILYVSETLHGMLTPNPPINGYRIPTAFVVHSHSNGTLAVRVPTVTDADGVRYLNYTSGLSSSNVQNAIDELSVEKADLSVLAGYVPTTRSVNGKFLTADISLTASDVGAPSGSGTSTGINTGDQDLSGYVPTTRSVNGKALTANVSLTASDVGAPSGSGTSSGTNTGDETASSILTKIGNGTVISTTYLPFKKGQLVGNSSGLRDDTITDNVNYFHFSNNGTTKVDYAAFAPSVKSGAKFGPGLSVTGTLATTSLSGVNGTYGSSLTIGSTTLHYTKIGNVYFLGMVGTGQSSNYFVGGSNSQIDATANKIATLLGKTLKGYVTNGGGTGFDAYYYMTSYYYYWNGSSWVTGNPQTPNGLLVALELN